MLFAKTKDYYSLTLALAGIFQAIFLVKSLAKTGKADEAAVLTLINSLYQKNDNPVDVIYGDVAHLYMGLKGVMDFFDTNKKPQQHQDVVRYLLGLLYLEKKLAHKSKWRDQLAHCMTRTAGQIPFFSPTHPTILANLADAYSQTVGTLNYRISILGRTSYLKREDLMNKMRALLLAGIRGAVLWRELGGNRWELLWGRKKFFTMARDLCRQCEQRNDVTNQTDYSLQNRK